MAYSRSKLNKHNLMAKSSSLNSALPQTRSLSKDNFISLLKKYRDVIVKPSIGSGGVGVMSVSSLNNGKYKIQFEKTIKMVKGLQSAYSFIRNSTNGSPYIVQQKITLAKVGRMPFDARVMIQRNKNSDWIITGKLAKIAGAGYIVTNVARSRGRVIPLSSAIRQSNLRGKSSSQIQSQMDSISLKVAKQLQKYYRIDTVGLDLGVDPNGKVWIIEANFTPIISLFLRLKDKSIYRKIKNYRLKRY
ncbi:YheC/YheD family protein [Ammoniphilus sp. CFH 90114]|uniref:YheC/YheD family protein n=1 Tax=Ammoniphilus sp. CFH 90114 TaxID=2493665 RepID=UPI00100F5E30|nr:YheC/YheD family protein [Ammoniphilus sp. CFH 90114]RXT07940.1 hypothetical protein EIZ39_11020 [Ammoniphilus sp. CFH 90114]